MSKKSRKNKRGAKNHSTIAQHKRSGKTLTPPLAQVPGMQLQSWRDERLPEVLWAALLTNLNRDLYLELFRSIASGAREFGENFNGVEHSSLAKLDRDEFDALLRPVLRIDELRDALRPLRLLEGLPDSAHWQRHLRDPDYEADFRTLAEAVSRNTFHQSEAATDCRWLKLFSMIAAGRVHYGPAVSETFKEIVEYPHRGDLRKVRPSIRAAEGAFANLGDEDASNEWPEKFWKLCWERSTCIILPRRLHEDPDNEHILEQVVAAYRDTAQHFYNVAENTGLDARRDTVFGLVLYGLNLCLTVNGSPAHRRAEGRLVIRALAEVVITLSFLLKRDNPTLWSTYRRYGSGQAKLAFLKLADLESNDVPGYIDIEELEILANEDVWQEYQEIALGHWADLDLRRMSDEAKVKAVYDKYYSWPSGFAHAHWTAVRDTTFDQCLNPLHRLHRVPSVPRINMGSVAPDSVKLANMLLSLLNKAYPTLKAKISVAKPQQRADPTKKSGGE